MTKTTANHSSNAPKTSRIHPAVKRDRKHRSYRSKTGQPKRPIPPPVDYPSHPDDPRLLLPPRELRPFAPVIWVPNPIDSEWAARGAVSRSQGAHTDFVNSAGNFSRMPIIHRGHRGGNQPPILHPPAARQPNVNGSVLNPAGAMIRRAVSREVSISVISKPSTPEPDGYPEGDSPSR